MDHIYLDNNATTPLHPEVAELMAAYYRAGYANAASQHRPGQQARRLVEDAREGIAELLGAATDSARSDQLVFTSGGTEANNMALRGLAGPPGSRLVVSSVEHPSVLETAEQLRREGYDVAHLPVTRSGVVQTDELPRLLSEPTRLVSVIWGHNETGVLQPLEQIATQCRQQDIPLHVDGVQVVGKLPINFHELDVATLSLAAHKFHGPRGIGALLVRGDIAVEPLLHGGFQQMGQRPGTESVELILGMFAALRIWHRDAADRLDRMRQLRDTLESLLFAGDPSIVIHGFSTDRLPNTTSASFPGVDRQQLVMALDLAGVACSTGSACASGSSEPSPSLLAMGLEPALINSALRFSLSALTTVADVDSAARRILQIYRDLQRKNAARKEPAGARQPPSKAV